MIGLWIIIPNSAFRIPNYLRTLLSALNLQSHAVVFSAYPSFSDVERYISP